MAPRRIFGKPWLDDPYDEEYEYEEPLATPPSRKRKPKPSTKPNKCPKTDAQPPQDLHMTPEEMDKVIPRLPRCDLLMRLDVHYSPETVFEAVKSYIPYLNNVLLHQNLGLPGERITRLVEESENVKTQHMPRKIIAVLGMTGAGKSSVHQRAS